MTAAMPAIGAAGGLRLRFPGVWRELPLHDNVVTREAVHRIVMESIGRADDRARLRAEVRDQLVAAASAARKANADRLVIAIEAVTDLPIPAFLGIYTPGLDVAAATTTAAVDVTVPEVPEGVDIAPQEIRNLLIDFWATVPGERRVILLSFSPAAAELGEPLFNLDRAIVSTAEWKQ